MLILFLQTLYFAYKQYNTESAKKQHFPDPAKMPKITVTIAGIDLSYKRAQE